MSDVLLRGHLIFPLSLAVSLNNNLLTATERFWFSWLPDVLLLAAVREFGQQVLKLLVYPTKSLRRALSILSLVIIQSLSRGYR